MVTGWQVQNMQGRPAGWTFRTLADVADLREESFVLRKPQCWPLRPLADETKPAYIMKGHLYLAHPSKHRAHRQGTFAAASGFAVGQTAGHHGPAQLPRKVTITRRICFGTIPELSNPEGIGPHSTLGRALCVESRWGRENANVWGNVRRTVSRRRSACRFPVLTCE